MRFQSLIYLGAALVQLGRAAPTEPVTVARGLDEAPESAGYNDWYESDSDSIHISSEHSAGYNDWYESDSD